jgi:hypothetical protein
LRLRQIFLALEHAPARLRQHRLEAVLHQPSGLSGAHIVESVIHLGHDVKAIQNIQSIAAALSDHPQVRPPHVGTDKLDLARQVRANQVKEFLKRLDRSLLANPQ